MADDTQQILAEQFTKLPKVIQDAILSGHIQERFRDMAKKYQLHLDQWQEVETTIMLSILGLSPIESIEEKIATATHIDHEHARVIVDDIAENIFLPVRAELERSLGHPMAHAEEVSDAEKLREAVLEAAPVIVSQSAKETVPTPVEVSPTQGQKVPLAPASGAYKPGETSAARDDVHDDPYREQPK